MVSKFQKCPAIAGTIAMGLAFLACCVALGTEWASAKYEKAAYTYEGVGYTARTNSLWVSTWKGTDVSTGEEKTTTWNIDDFCKDKGTGNGFCYDVSVMRGCSITAMIVAAISTACFLYGHCLRQHGHELFVMFLNIGGWLAVPSAAFAIAAAAVGYAHVENAEKFHARADEFWIFEWDTPAKVEAGVGLQLQLVSALLATASLALAFFMRTMCPRNYCCNCTCIQTTPPKKKGHALPIPGLPQLTVSSMGATYPPQQQYPGGGYPQQQYPSGMHPELTYGGYDYGGQQRAFGPQHPPSSTGFMPQSTHGVQAVHVASGHHMYDPDTFYRSQFQHIGQAAVDPATYGHRLPSDGLYAV